LHESRYNRPDYDNRFTPPKVTSGNDLWTVSSQAWGGFVVGDDYILLGFSGGHKTGLGYKILNDAGKKCPGPCAKNPRDYSNYFWVYDMNEIVSASFPWEPKPYAYGPLSLGVGEGHNMNSIRIGSFIRGVDYVDGHVYLAIAKADRTQGEWLKQPVLLKYRVCDTLPAR
jgi:hypothetical protein